jgi:ABC-type dipeptide/oligopeptide/nickel transport system permease component
VDILNFLRKRFIHMIPVLFGIVLVVFLMVRLIPGDPARIMLGTHATPERLSELRAELGLDEPIWRQFLLFMGNVVQGDLGTSLVYRRSVFDVILDRLPPTLFLITYAAIMSLALTIPLALVAAVRQNSLPDQSVRVGSTMALSMPSFWLGLNLLVIFAVRLRWFPVAGYGEDFLDRGMASFPAGADHYIGDGADLDPQPAQWADRCLAGALRGIRACQRHSRDARASPPCPAQCDDLDGHDPGFEHWLADGWLGCDRNRFFRSPAWGR